MLQRIRQLFDSPPPKPAATPPVYALQSGMRAYVVGDIHGRAELLKTMLATIETDAQAHPGPQIVEIFLGDYIDRGLHSRAVIDLLIAPPPPGHTRICLMGNHEEALLKFLRDPTSLRAWGNFGGFATLASYGIAIPHSMTPENLAQVRDTLLKNMPPSHHAFLQGLRLFYTLGDYLFVHAGIAPGVPLDAQKPEHLLKIREPFLNHTGFFEQYVVHGHSPQHAPDIRENRANLDVSNATTDSLACLRVETTTRQVILVTK